MAEAAGLGALNRPLRRQPRAPLSLVRPSPRRRLSGPMFSSARIAQTAQLSLRHTPRLSLGVAPLRYGLREAGARGAVVSLR